MQLHLHRYLSEFDSRFNARRDDIGRLFNKILSRADVCLIQNFWAKFIGALILISSHGGFGALQTPPDTDAMVAICESLSAPPSTNWYYPYVGYTWAVFGYDFTWYNHAVTPNSAVPDCSINGSQSLTLANWKTSLHGVHKASSRHPNGVNVLYMDGRVRFDSDIIDTAVWHGIATIDGREL